MFQESFHIDICTENFVKYFQPYYYVSCEFNIRQITGLKNVSTMSLFFNQDFNLTETLKCAIATSERTVQEVNLKAFIFEENVPQTKIFSTDKVICI